MLRHPFDLHSSKSFADMSEWIQDRLDSAHALIQVRCAFQEHMQGLTNGEGGGRTSAVWSTAKFELPIRVRDHPDKIRRISGSNGERILYLQLSGYEERARHINQDDDFIID